MTRLTDAQWDKLFGRKRPFVPTGYRKKIQDESRRVIREAQGGEISDSQTEMAIRNIKRGHGKPPVARTDRPLIKRKTGYIKPPSVTRPEKPIEEKTLAELSQDFRFRRFAPLLRQLDRDQKSRTRQFRGY